MSKFIFRKNQTNMSFLKNKKNKRNFFQLGTLNFPSENIGLSLDFERESSIS